MWLPRTGPRLLSATLSTIDRDKKDLHLPPCAFVSGIAHTDRLQNPIGLVIDRDRLATRFYASIKTFSAFVLAAALKVS